ncbi:STAS domain-containing protein [Micromonospora sp. NPDC048930]|uniref:STAS domain-containing protein n=1 Tax=Micromonospora sp. NPDC048930 TaxID=3364261 RepID=UPI003710ED25
MSTGTSWQHDVVTEGGSTCILLSGELDLEAVEQLRDLLRTSTQASTEVLADLAAVSFIDSTVIGLFIETRHATATSGRSFAIQNPSPPVRRVFDVMGIFEFLAERG